MSQNDLISPLRKRLKWAAAKIRWKETKLRMWTLLPPSEHQSRVFPVEIIIWYNQSWKLTIFLETSICRFKKKKAWKLYASWLKPTWTCLTWDLDTSQSILAKTAGIETSLEIQSRFRSISSSWGRYFVALRINVMSKYMSRRGFSASKRDFHQL